MTCVNKCPSSVQEEIFKSAVTVAAQALEIFDQSLATHLNDIPGRMMGLAHAFSIAVLDYERATLRFSTIESVSLNASFLLDKDFYRA